MEEERIQEELKEEEAELEKKQNTDDNQEGEQEEPGKQEKQKDNEIEELRDRIIRLQADFDNYRKRMMREKEDWYKYAGHNLTEKLLPVIDNIDLALGSLGQQKEEVKNLFAGFEMINKQLMDILQQEGLEPITAVGQKFDPHLHEAMMQVPTEDEQQDNQVVEELRKGYRFKDRVIRPAMVKVAKKNQN